MRVSEVMSVMRAYSTVDKFTIPEHIRRQGSVPKNNSAVEVSISDEAKKLNEAANRANIEQDLAEPTINELFTK